MNWYYALNGSQVGPVTDSEIARLVSAGTLTADSLVWRDGLPDWQTVSVALPAALGTMSAEVPQIGGVPLASNEKDTVIQQMREGVSGIRPGTFRYAGFWIRVVARMIDGLILAIPQFGMNFLFALVTSTMITPPAAGTVPEFELSAVLLFLVGMVLNVSLTCFYNAFLVSRYGATWGKMALGLKVVNEDGTRLSGKRAIGRFFAEIVSSMTMAIGFVIAAFDSEKRTLHDRICATRVIKAD